MVSQLNEKLAVTVADLVREILNTQLCLLLLVLLHMCRADLHFFKRVGGRGGGGG